MNDADRLTRAFAELTGLDDRQQLARLREIERDDPALARQLAGLLEAHHGHHAALDDDIVARAAELLTGYEAENLVGRTLGEYRLDELLGRGGMSVVFRATRHHEGVDRPVALKLLALPMFDARTAERFSREAAILARLEHRAICRLHDWGRTEQGWPYLALDLVRGRPIDEYCRDNSLSLASRLALMRQVAEAVAYAHRRLIVHLDLKPANVMVTTDGWPVLLDFGVSQVLSGNGSQAATTVARWLTPDYASPEQLRGEPPAIASDIYGLGVMLYELVAERRPFHFADSSLIESLERIAAGAAPPSTLRRTLPRDLDAVLACAMHHDPERRYPTADAFANDLSAVSESRPVRARKDTWWYRARKLVQRHPVSAPAGAVAASSIFALAAMLAVQSFDLRAQRDEAERERARAEAVTEFMVRSIDAVNPRTVAETGIGLSGLLEVTETRLKRDASVDAVLRVALLEQIARARLALWEYDEALDSIDEALAVLNGTSDAQTGVQARFLALKSSALRSLGDYARALEIADAAVAAAEPGSGELFDARRSRAQALERLGRFDESDAYTRATLATLDPSEVRRRADLHNDLAASALSRADFVTAEREADAAHRLYAQAHPEPHMDTSEAAWRRAAALLNTGRAGEALELLEEALQLRVALYGPTDHRVGEIHYVMSHALDNLGRSDDALAEAERALAIYRDTLKEDDRRLVAAYGNVGSKLRRVGRDDEALRILQETLLLGERLYGDLDHPDLGAFRNMVGESFIALGRFDEAVTVFEPLLSVYAASAGEPSVPTTFIRHNLARALRELGRPQDAVIQARAAAEQARVLFPPGQWIPEVIDAELAWAIADAGDLDAARILADEVFERLSAAPARVPPRHGRSIARALAAIYGALGDSAALDRVQQLLE